MFTGIVSAIGRIAQVDARPGGLRLRIETPPDWLQDASPGDSIAVSGVCLTVVGREPAAFEVDVSQESLACTAGLEGTGEVNLEQALRLADRLGGHLVSGHVDGVGKVLRFESVGESHLLEIEAPEALAKYIAPKGSIAVDGVSLTVNRVKGGVKSGADGARFEINLIPHSLSVTTLKRLAPGARVNLEVDQIARYVARMLGRG